jgi:hypothetical protein
MGFIQIIMTMGRNVNIPSPLILYFHPHPGQLVANSTYVVSDSHPSPEDYARLIDTYAGHVMGTSLFCGELFGGLSGFLCREFNSAENVNVDVVAHIPSAPSVEEHAIRRHICSNASQLFQLLTVYSPEHHSNSLPGDQTAIVFMRGHQPPECLNRLGAMYNINPLFYQRHLEYLWSTEPPKLFSSPSLPSASFNTIRFRIFSVGETDVGSNSLVESLREDGEKSMANYLHDLRCEVGLQSGTSIVRAFNIHDVRYFSIEQEVTATVQVTGNKWLSA